MEGRNLIIFYYLLNLAVAQDTRLAAAGALGSTTLKAAAGLVASPVLELESSAVETQAHVVLVRGDIIAPEEVEC